MFLILALIGFFSNGLSFLIIVNQGLINAGIWVYIACLSLVDNLAIIMACITILSKDAPFDFISDVFITSDYACKLLTIFEVIWSLLSLYIMCLMTVERCILVLKPFKSPTGQKRAIINVLVLCIVMFIFVASYILPIKGLSTLDVVDELNNSTISLSVCRVLPEYETSAYHMVISVCNMVFSAVIPIVILITANSLIVFALIRRAKNEALASSNRNVNKDKNITYMLLGISSYFLLSLTPYIIFLGTWHFFYESLTMALSPKSILYLIMIVIGYSNHCVNFFFYVLSGETFREKTKLFLKSLKCSKDEMVSVIELRGKGVQRQSRQRNTP